MNNFRLGSLGALTRLGLTAALGCLLLGFWASFEHMRQHHAPRDGQPGVSMDDLVGSYHGLERPSELVLSLERGHPEDLPDTERSLLLEWLGGSLVSEQYDDLDLGDASPAEVLSRRCLECHSRQSGGDSIAAQDWPLDYWDDVAQLAFSRSVEATPREIVITSLHTHATTLAMLTLLVLLMLTATRWPRGLQGLLSATAGLALAADLSGQLLARDAAGLTWLVAGGGAVWSACVLFSCVLVLLEMWLPAGAGGKT